MKRYLLAGLVVAMAGGPACERAQAQTAESSAPASLAPLWPDHWSYDFMELAGIKGWAESWHPWQAPAVARSVGEALSPEPGSPAGDRAGDAPTVLRRWAQRFDREVGRSRPASSASRPFLLAADGGYQRSDAVILEELEGFWRARAEVWAASWLTLWAEGSNDLEGQGSRLRTGGASLRIGDLQILAGRLRPGLGQGEGRILLNGRTDFDGVWLGSARPVALPGLGFLGPVTGHVFAGPDGRSPTVDGAWFGTLALTVAPHRRIKLGVIRTARFAGGVEEGSVEKVARLVFLGGTEGSFFDDGNGVLHARASWSLGGLDGATYVGVGFEDRNALWEDPGIVAGTVVPFTLPGGDLLSVRYEYEAFGKRAMWCRWCDFIPHRWFRQRTFGRYEADGYPIGSTLGGYGSAHRLELQLWSAGAPFRLRASAFRERRESLPVDPEFTINLLLDRWPGLRRGFRVTAASRPRPGWELEVSGVLTDTEVGNEHGVTAVVRILDVFWALGG